MKWNELHKMSVLEGVSLTPKQEVCMAYASDISIQDYCLIVSNFDTGKAQELLESMTCLTMFAEHLGNHMSKEALVHHKELLKEAKEGSQ